MRAEPCLLSIFHHGSNVSLSQVSTLSLTPSSGGLSISSLHPYPFCMAAGAWLCRHAWGREKRVGWKNRLAERAGTAEGSRCSPSLRNTRHALLGTPKRLLEQTATESSLFAQSSLSQIIIIFRPEKGKHGQHEISINKGRLSSSWAGQFPGWHGNLQARGGAHPLQAAGLGARHASSLNALQVNHHFSFQGRARLSPHLRFEIPKLNSPI